MLAPHAPTSTIPELPPITTEATATLPVSAGVAFEAFADALGSARWLPIVQSARVLERTIAGRPVTVAFVGRLRDASVGYVLRYAYDPTSLSVTWTSPPEATVQISGEARFVALSARACLITYRLSCESDNVWADQSYENHGASAVVAAFREHLRAAAAS